MITGKTLIEWGFAPGAWFNNALAEANRMRLEGSMNETIRQRLRDMEPKVHHLPLQAPVSVHYNIETQTPEEIANLASVRSAMDVLATIPTVRAGAVMPDACPAGTIPVGGVVATENAIHPGFHSADICCSVAFANLGFVDPKIVLDRAMQITHFGPGGRTGDAVELLPPSLERWASDNKMIQKLAEPLVTHFATQGDGNHFLSVGKLASTGETCVVTHHGSRGPGAKLYSAGMKLADKFRLEMSPETPKDAAWIPADTEEGRAYWDALQFLRAWTKSSHLRIHSMIGFEIHDWFWNEHNFVFEREGRFYHAKGATPGWSDYDRTLVPLNMAEPILITRGTGVPHGLGFLPHGAGRNMSRTRFLRENPALAIPAGIDARFFSGKPDMSELPQAYKSAAEVRRQMKAFNLAEIIDEVIPYGNIMAGEQDQWWRKK